MAENNGQAVFFRQPADFLIEQWAKVDIDRLHGKHQRCQIESRLLELADASHALVNLAG